MDLYKSVMAEGRYTLLLLKELQRNEEVERQTIASDIKRPGCLRVFAEVDGLIVGMARVRAGERTRNAHFGERDSVWVHSDWRRQGIGNAFIDAIVRRAEGNEKIEKFGFFIFSNSEAAIALYQGNGFIIMGRAPRDIKFADDGYADTVIMGKIVDRALLFSGATHPAEFSWISKPVVQHIELGRQSEAV